MTRKEFEALVLDTYGTRADYPFEDDFETGVFRHESGKWFALAMNIGERKIGYVGDEKIDVVMGALSGLRESMQVLKL